MTQELQSDKFTIAQHSYPVFVVHRISPYEVAFRCPKCKHQNVHGWPNGQPESEFGGHRASHCECYPRGYIITAIA